LNKEGKNKKNWLEASALERANVRRLTERGDLKRRTSKKEGVPSSQKNDFRWKEE